MLYGRSPFLHDNPNMMFGKILEDEPIFPKEFKYSDESTDLIKKLLKKNGNERIGVDDEQEIFTHPWFNDIDFGKLNQKKLPALIIPHIDEEGPYNHFMGQEGDEEMIPQEELELSFEKEYKDKEHRKSQQINSTAAVFPQRKTPDASFEDFSYFEEEDAVETPLHDDDRFLEEEWQEERRVQLLTNIEEGEEYGFLENDPFASPKNEEEEAKSPKAEKTEPVTEYKPPIGTRTGSMELSELVPIPERLDHRTIDMAELHQITNAAVLEDLKAWVHAVKNGARVVRPFSPPIDGLESHKELQPLPVPVPVPHPTRHDQH